jgi:hypothetical protein
LTIITPQTVRKIIGPIIQKVQYIPPLESGLAADISACPYMMKSRRIMKTPEIANAYVLNVFSLGAPIIVALRSSSYECATS